MQVEFLDTPAERRRLKVRELILSAAEQVFAHEGSEGLSIRRLAREIDYSPAAIYKYFDSKDELVLELKEAFFAKLLEKIHLIADQELPYNQRLRNCVATYVQVAVEKPFHYGAAFAGRIVHKGPAENEPGFEDSNKGLAFLVLKNMVQEGIDGGYIRDDLDASLGAKSIWCSVHGLAMMMLHAPDFPALTPSIETMPGDEFIRFHADIVARGLEASR